MCVGRVSKSFEEGGRQRISDSDATKCAIQGLEACAAREQTEPLTTRVLRCSGESSTVIIEPSRPLGGPSTATHLIRYHAFIIIDPISMTPGHADRTYGLSPGKSALPPRVTVCLLSLQSALRRKQLAQGVEGRRRTCQEGKGALNSGTVKPRSYVSVGRHFSFRYCASIVSREMR
jgi:hypothetical protein